MYVYKIFLSNLSRVPALTLLGFTEISALKESFFFFKWKKEASHSFKVKHLQFHMKEVLFCVSLIKNNTLPTSSTHSFAEQ